MKGIRVQKKRSGEIIIAHEPRRFVLRCHPSGGQSAYRVTESQYKKALGKTGGKEINEGGSRYIIEALFFPGPTGAPNSKLETIAEMLGIWLS
jgi:hypothetical protein